MIETDPSGFSVGGWSSHGSGVALVPAEAEQSATGLPSRNTVIALGSVPESTVRSTRNVITRGALAVARGALMSACCPKNE